MLANPRRHATLIVALAVSSSLGCGGDSSAGSSVTEALSLEAVIALAPPSGLAATPVSSSQINLSWQATGGPATSLLIETRVGSSTVYSTVATVAAGATAYQHTGLAPATRYAYHIRACVAAQCSERPAEAAATTVATVVAGTAPAVETRTASAITAQTATIGGTITANRFATTAWSEYGTSPTLAGATSTEARAAGDGSAAYVLEVHLTGLAEGLTYYHRAVALNSAGRTNGPIQSFKTSGSR